jgi:hypothetical protein
MVAEAGVKRFTQGAGRCQVQGRRRVFPRPIATRMRFGGMSRRIVDLISGALCNQLIAPQKCLTVDNDAAIMHAGVRLGMSENYETEGVSV